jgi:hypothetical protein
VSFEWEASSFEPLLPHAMGTMATAQPRSTHNMKLEILRMPYSYLSRGQYTDLGPCVHKHFFARLRVDRGGKLRT